MFQMQKLKHSPPRRRRGIRRRGRSRGQRPGRLRKRPRKRKRQRNRTILSLEKSTRTWLPSLEE